MKITKTQLKTIIKEEYSRMVNEAYGEVSVDQLTDDAKLIIPAAKAMKMENFSQMRGPKALEAVSEQLIDLYQKMGEDTPGLSEYRQATDILNQTNAKIVYPGADEQELKTASEKMLVMTDSIRKQLSKNKE